jgi:hypothetical protein
VYFPRGEGAQLVRLLHVIEKRQHLAEFVHSVLRHAFSVVLRVKPFQALMDDVPYFHAKPSVACNLTLVKAGAPSIQAIEFVVEQVATFPYSCSGSLDRFSSGSTATERVSTAADLAKMWPRNMTEANQTTSAATPLTVKTLISFQRIRAQAGRASTGRSITSTARRRTTRGRSFEFQP